MVLKLMLAIIIIMPFSSAFAYLDPGSGGMLLQLLFGGVAGAFAIVKLYWHQIKEKVFRKREDINKQEDELGKNRANDR